MVRQTDRQTYLYAGVADGFAPTARPSGSGPTSHAVLDRSIGSLMQCNACKYKNKKSTVSKFARHFSIRHCQSVVVDGVDDGGDAE